MELGAKRTAKNSNVKPEDPVGSKKKKAEDDAGELLPPGWTKRFSVRKNRAYFFNEQTGQSSWDPPKQVRKEDSRQSYFNDLHKKMTLKLAEDDPWQSLKTFALQKAPKFKQKYSLPTPYADLLKKNVDVDIVAKLLLPSDIPKVKPLVTEATGNCLFNAFSLILFGTNACHLELRVRTVCELLLNEELYLNNKNLRTMSDESVKSCDILQYLISTTESYSTSSGTLKEAYKDEVLQSIFESRYCSMIHLYAMTNVLNIMIHSVYPNIKNVGVNRRIHHQIISPLSEIHRSKTVPKMPIYVMWSNKTELLVNKDWAPDHFVALLPYNIQLNMYTSKEKQEESNTDINSSTPVNISSRRTSDDGKWKPFLQQKSKTVQDLISQLISKGSSNSTELAAPSGESHNKKKMLPKFKLESEKVEKTNSTLNTSIVSYSDSDDDDDDDNKVGTSATNKTHGQNEKAVKLGKRKSDIVVKDSHDSGDDVKKTRQNHDDTLDKKDDTGCFKGLKFSIKSPKHRNKLLSNANKLQKAAQNKSESETPEKNVIHRTAFNDHVDKQDNVANKNQYNQKGKIKPLKNLDNSKQAPELMTGSFKPRSVTVSNVSGKKADDENSTKGDRKILKASRRTKSSDGQEKAKGDAEIISSGQKLLDSILKGQQFTTENFNVCDNQGDHSYKPLSKSSRTSSASSNVSVPSKSPQLPSYEQVSTPPWSRQKSNSSSRSPEPEYFKGQKRLSESELPSKSSYSSPHSSQYGQDGNKDSNKYVSPLNRRSSTDKAEAHQNSYVSPLNRKAATSKDPLQFLTGMLGLENMGGTPQRTESTRRLSGSSECDMEIDITEIQSENILHHAKDLYVVVDTNVLIADIDFIIELKDQNFPDIGKPSIVIPWVTLQELDSVKMGKSKNYSISTDTKFKARIAINEMNSLLESHHPRFIGQTAQQCTEKMANFETNSNDDRVLKCCLQYLKKYPESKVVLLSDDKNLRNKAIVSQIAAFGIKTFTKWLEKLGPKEEAVIKQQPFHQNPASISFHSPPPHFSPLSSSGVSDSRRSVTPTEPEAKKYTEVDLADDIFCEVKTSLRDSLAAVLEDEMKNAYDDIWEDIVYKKPPWTLIDILESIKKHWIAVFGSFMDRDIKSELENLTKHYKRNSFDLSLKHLQRILTDSSVFCKQFPKASTYTNAIEKTVCDIEKLKRVIKSVIDEAVPIDRLTVLKENLQNSSGGTKSLDNDTDVQMSECSSNNQNISNANQTVNVQQRFQIVWEAVLNSYNLLNDQLTGDPQGPGRTKALEYFAKLCANIGAIHVTYSGSLKGDSSHVKKLCLALDTFAQHLNVKNWISVDVAAMSSFFTESGQRTVLEGGLQQLEAMMTAISGLQNYLTAAEVQQIGHFSNVHTATLGIV